MAAELTLELQPIKTFHFTWADVADATHYKLLENADGTSEFIQVGDDVAAAEQAIDHIVPLYARVNAKYILQSCNANACIDSDPVEVTGTLQEAIGYVKASNTDSGDSFGTAVALSSDGKTLAIGAPDEASVATGVDGDQDDDSLLNSGAVYVFTHEANGWTQQAYLKASTVGPERFGHSLALSANGNTLVVGAPGPNDFIAGPGAAYVFERMGTSWGQHSLVEASNREPRDNFGHAVALSADGTTLAVGAPFEGSNATGLGGDEGNNEALGAGAVYVFTRVGTSWSQQAYVKASNTKNNDILSRGDRFGVSVAMSADGTTLAVGASWEASNAIGVGGDESNIQALGAGAVYVFVLSGAAWNQQAYVKASNTKNNADPVGGDKFGACVAVSDDGNTLVIGAPKESSSSTGVDGNQGNTAAASSGAVYVFSRNNSSWSQEAYVKSSNSESGDEFGCALALGGDGDTFVVGARGEDGATTGIDGADSNLASGAGAAYVFSRSETSWGEESYVKAKNTGGGDSFGSNSLWLGSWVLSLALSADASTLAVGAFREDSSATGNVNDNTAPGAGAVYLY